MLDSTEQQKENLRVPPTNYQGLVPPSTLLDSIIPSAPMIYKERDIIAEMEILYEFLTKGIDNEDIEYLRQSYEALLANDQQSYWLNDTHWVDHPASDIPPPYKKKKRDDLRVHLTGSARTEGYYKVELGEKLKHKVKSKIVKFEVFHNLSIVFNSYYLFVAPLCARCATNTHGWRCKSDCWYEP